MIRKTLNMKAVASHVFIDNLIDFAVFQSYSTIIWLGFVYSAITCIVEFSLKAVKCGLIVLHAS